MFQSSIFPNNIPRNNIHQPNIFKSSIFQNNIPQHNILQIQNNIPQPNIPQPNVFQNNIPQYNIPRNNIFPNNIPQRVPVQLFSQPPEEVISYQITKGICPVCFYQLSTLNIAGTVRSCNNCHTFFSLDLSTNLFTIQNYSASYNIHENKINKENEMKFEFIDLSDENVERNKEND
jgi:hypothetical protein